MVASGYEFSFDDRSNWAREALQAQAGCGHACGRLWRDICGGDRRCGRRWLGRVSKTFAMVERNDLGSSRGPRGDVDRMHELVAGKRQR